jgi:uncharacterized protein
VSATGRPGAITRGVRWLAALSIKGYQRAVSPLFPPTCRFHPSCSAYALTSIERFGVLRGGWLAVKRIGRCHPFNPGGYDPVPETLPRH